MIITIWANQAMEAQKSTKKENCGVVQGDREGRQDWHPRGRLHSQSVPVPRTLTPRSPRQSQSTPHAPSQHPTHRQQVLARHQPPVHDQQLAGVVGGDEADVQGQKDVGEEDGAWGDVCGGEGGERECVRVCGSVCGVCMRGWCVVCLGWWAS